MLTREPHDDPPSVLGPVPEQSLNQTLSAGEL